MQELASKLSDRFGGASAFFCNSGAESVEAALKWARKSTGRAGLRRARGLVPRAHGRRALDHRPAGEARRVRAAAPGRALRDAGDARRRRLGARPRRSCSSRCRAKAACIRSPAETLAEARELADAHGALLVFDEVQTGVGRCGSFFAWEQLGVKPDAVTLAKGLANGLPIGALLVSDDAPDRLRAGRPRRRRSAATSSRAPPRARSSTRSTTRCSRTCATCRRSSPPGSRRSARCAASASCSASSSTGRPARSSRPRSPTASWSAPPASARCGSHRRSSISADEAALAVDILAEVLA